MAFRGHRLPIDAGPWGASRKVEEEQYNGKDCWY